MTFAPRLRRYLEHFGPTVPLTDYVARPGEKNLVALRHDVDYDLDIALEMAFWEHRLDRRATYFVLHTAGYWDDPLLIDKCLQIQDLGHEVGLHTNLVTQWYKGDINDVGEALNALLDRFRDAGLDIKGVAAHGDALCYEVGFTNYWLFKELRPGDPFKAEAGVTAEGTQSLERNRAISYPATGDALRRPDGAQLDYWSLRLSDFGLRYEGSRVKADHYHSDSGGDWKRSPDPLNADLSRGRNLVLMHPIHWKDRQTHYYFLSTARSGSKWLANFLDNATSVTARHEFTLNHKFKKGELIADKRTGVGLAQLLASKSEVDRLIHEARTWSESLNHDYAEANIYLEQVIDRLPHDADTRYVHLHRNPEAVVRSLIQRGWYAVPFDTAHPPVPIPQWHQLSQLEQACWYVRDVNERLSSSCTSTLSFELMVSDLNYLSTRLEELGIAVYPRLAKPIFDTPLNATAFWDVQPASSWPVEDRETFMRICRPVLANLGYGPYHDRPQPGGRSVRKALTPSAEKLGPPPGPHIERLADLHSISQLGALSVRNCTLLQDGEGLGVRFPPHDSGYLMLGGGFFHGAAEAPEVVPTNDTRKSPLGGWPITPGRLYTVGLSLDFVSFDTTLRLICLSYDAEGKLVDRRNIGVTSKAASEIACHFRPSRAATAFNLALFKAREQGEAEICIKDFALTSHAENRSAAISPQEALRNACPLPDEPRESSLINSIFDLTDVFVTMSRGREASWRVEIESFDGTIRITPSLAEHHGYALLAGGTWNCALKKHTSGSEGTDCKWRTQPNGRLSGYLCGKLSGLEDKVAVFVLSYDARGHLVQTLRVGTLSGNQESVSFSYVLPPNAYYCNVSLSFPAGSGGIELTHVGINLVFPRGVSTSEVVRRLRLVLAEWRTSVQSRAGRVAQLLGYSKRPDY